MTSNGKIQKLCIARLLGGDKLAQGNVLTPEKYRVVETISFPKKFLLLEFGCL